MKTILLKVSYAKTLPERVIGLIGAKKPRAVMLKTHFGIHTFGVRFPIDVLVLDKQDKVVSIKQSLKTNRLFFWNPLWDIVIELPEGTIDKKNVKKGDQIQFTA